MPEEQFWDLIETLDHSSGADGYERLAAQLGETDLATLVAFQARLTLALFALDSGCRAQWYEQNDPLGLGFVSDDTFLYARCDTVTAGREVWQEAVDSDTLPWGEVDPTTGGGESLLYVTAGAADLMGVSVDDLYDAFGNAFTLSFETGSNPTGWG